MRPSKNFHIICSRCDGATTLKHQARHWKSRECQQLAKQKEEKEARLKEKEAEKRRGCQNKKSYAEHLNAVGQTEIFIR
jgi:hypothetical protein